MKQHFIFITGNQHKADYLTKWLGMPVKHRKLDLDELQSLDLRTVVEHKVRQAYDIVKKPVLVEDVALSFSAMGRLPGTFIKWFLEDLGDEGICKFVDGLNNRKAEAVIEYALYDGTSMHFFSHKTAGQVPLKPRGSNGFGWNSIFIPDGSTKTFAEMSDKEVQPFNMRAQAIEKLRTYLQNA